MKKYRFSLRPIAVIRAHKESCAKEEFAAAVRAYVRAEEELAEVRLRISKFAHAIFASRRERFEVGEHALCLAGFRRESASEIPAERAVISARAAMDGKRQAYLDAHREVEVVRKLEEKSRAAYRSACNLEEQAEFDEMSRGANSRTTLNAV
jgi:flagellar FliJ protein